MNKDKFLQAVKNRWVSDYLYMSNETQCDGYTILGFIIAVIDDYEKDNKENFSQN